MALVDRAGDAVFWMALVARHFGADRLERGLRITVQGRDSAMAAEPASAGCADAASRRADSGSRAGDPHPPQ